MKTRLPEAAPEPPEGRTQPWALEVQGPKMTRLTKQADAWGYDMLSMVRKK